MSEGVDDQEACEDVHESVGSILLVLGIERALEMVRDNITGRCLVQV